MPAKPPLSSSLGNSVWLAAVPASRMVFGMFVGLAVTRHLGPGRFGELSFAIALLALAAPFADLGLTAFLRTELLSRRFPPSRLIATVVRLRLLGGGLAMFAGAVLAWRSGLHTLGLCVAAAGTLFNPLLTTPEQWFSARLESRLAAIPQIAALLIASAIRASLIMTDAPLWAFAACMSVETVVAGAWLFRSLRSRQSFAWRDFDPAIARMALRSSLPLLLTVGALAIQSRIDQLMIGRHLGTEGLGLFAAAVRFSDLAAIALSALCTSFLPHFMAARENQPGDSAHGLQELADLLVAAALAWALFCSCTAWFWLPILLGESFRPAAGLLALHSWNAVFLAMGFARSTLWTVQGRNHLTLATTVIGSALSVVLNIVLTPRLGAWAAVGIALSAALVTNLLLSMLAPGESILSIQMRALLGTGRVLRTHRSPRA